ncbi:putative Major facilitator superfamily (MFS) profile domain-containing protein [Seiridium cardinale]
MRVLTPLASLSWLIDSTLAAFRYMPAALNEMPLNKFQGSDGFNGGSGGAFWYNSIPIDRSVHMTLEEVYRIASGHFNWLKKEGDNHREVINFGTGGCLVPALWIPQTRVVYVATFPRGPFRNMMLQLPQYGSIWRQHITNNFEPGQTGYHSEDAVYFL